MPAKGIVNESLPKENKMDENEISKVIFDCSLKIHKTLGPGLLESVYEKVLLYELRNCNLKCESQVPLPVSYEGMKIDIGFIADIIIEDKVIIEIKSVEAIHPVHKKQLLTYLKVTDKKLGMLINFGAELIKDGISRIVNGL